MLEAALLGAKPVHHLCPMTGAPARSRCWSPRCRGGTPAICRARSRQCSPAGGRLDVDWLAVQQAIAVKARSGRRCPERVGILQERLELRTGAPRHGRGVSSYRFVTLGQQKQGRTANPKNRKQAPCESKELCFLFKYLLTNRFFATYAASAKVGEIKFINAAKNSGNLCAKKRLPLAKIARQVDC
jgi:hypothetical protein